ncbi:MAG: MBOAT family protein [Lachnospiraceae bacterium]|nr:MBOAT family protein [Lachnospiraceae bacterium]
MLFNSYLFLICFLPIVLFLYYGAHRLGMHKIALCVLSVGSFVFYAYDNPYYPALLAGSIIINWIVACIINRIISTETFDKGRSVLGKTILALGILTDVGIIFYFKYYDFFISNLNAVFKADFNLKHIILPLGISFFTFQQISYLVDTYKGETKGYSFIEYVSFVSFFPQLVAGPIVLHGELISQYRDESRYKISADRFANGLYVLAIGMFKKVMIADVFGKAVTWAWTDIHSRTGLELLLTSLFYTFQLYFDFSGYCDMAIGIAKLFSMDLPVNFNSPYKAVSIADFWKRWHMTLTRFLTNYIYIPLGGSRKGKARTYVNIMIVFLVSGIWHGANWTFIIWGLIHGLLMVLCRVGKKIWDKVPKVIAWFITFALVNMLWVMFYAPSVSDGLYVWKRILMPGGFFGANPVLFECFALEEITLVLGLFSAAGHFVITHSVINMIAYVVIAFAVCLGCRNLHEENFSPSIGKAVLSALLLVWAVLSFSGVSTFLYFNF